MDTRHEPRRRMGLALLLAASVAGAIALAHAHSAAEVPAACVVAVVDGVTVDDEDARELGALLSPPPSADQVRRLALDAAIAQGHLRGHLADASARARLEAYRELMTRLHKTAPVPSAFADGAHALLESLRREHGVATGSCYPASPEPAPSGAPPALGAEPDATEVHARLSRENQQRPVLRLEELWIPVGDGASAEAALERLRSITSAEPGARWASLAGGDVHWEDLGLVTPNHLVAELANAALGLRAGEVSTPVRTRHGVHVVRAIERYEPGALRKADVERYFDSRQP